MCSTAQASQCDLQPGLEAIRETSRFAALQDEWSRLWEQDPEATLFQSPEWLIPWWTHVADGELLTLTMRSNVNGERNALVGLAPFYVYRRPDGRRDLLPLGAGTSDYLGGIALPDFKSRAANALWRELDTCATEWNYCEIPQLREENLLAVGTPPDSWSDEREFAEPCLVLRTDELDGALPTSIPHRARQKLFYARRYAERHGALTIERANAHNLAEFLDALFRLHAARWTVRDGSSGVLADERVRRFHSDALPRLQALGALRMFGFRVNGRLIGVHLGMLDRRPPQPRASYYIGGFDPEFCQLSPGVLLIGHAIEDAVREGARSFDFLRGREAYKYAWGAREEQTFRRALCPRSCISAKGGLG